MSAYVRQSLQTEQFQVLNLVFAFRGVFCDPLRELRLNALNLLLSVRLDAPGHSILATPHQKPAPNRLAHSARRQGYVLSCEALDVPPSAGGSTKLSVGRLRPIADDPTILLLPGGD